MSGREGWDFYSLPRRRISHIRGHKSGEKARLWLQWPLRKPKRQTINFGRRKQSCRMTMKFTLLSEHYFLQTKSTNPSTPAPKRAKMFFIFFSYVCQPFLEKPCSSGSKKDYGRQLITSDEPLQTGLPEQLFGWNLGLLTWHSAELKKLSEKNLLTSGSPASYNSEVEPVFCNARKLTVKNGPEANISVYNVFHFWWMRKLLCSVFVRLCTGQNTVQ